MNKHEMKLADFFKHIGEAIEDAHEHNVGLQLVIKPQDVHELYVAFKAENLIIH